MMVAEDVFDWWIDEHAQCLSVENETRVMLLVRLMVLAMTEGPRG